MLTQCGASRIMDET